MSSDLSPDAVCALAPAGSNFGLKDEIRAYWSQRAETFDLSYGHKIRSRAELDAWARLIAGHAPIAPGDRVLELASGTGEVTRVLLGFGCSIDAIDLCEPMIARAQAKHQGAPVRFHLGDAENTMMPDAVYDLVICRHLVWTLVDPERALADWLRVLKPGGALVIVDGDWVNRSRKAVFFQRLSQAGRLADIGAEALGRGGASRDHARRLFPGWAERAPAHGDARRGRLRAAAQRPPDRRQAPPVRLRLLERAAAPARRLRPHLHPVRPQAGLIPANARRA